MKQTGRQHEQERGRRLSGGFTLVELMVVVAVIGLLSALTLPALERSRSSARRIQCVGHLRQLGLAVMLYWDDHEGRAFRYRGSAIDGGDVYWFGWLERGLEGDRAFDPTRGPLHPYLGGRGVSLCPSLAYALREFKLKARGASYGYGYNLQLSAPAGQSVVDVTRIARPSGIVVLTDAAQVNTFQAPATPERPMLEEFYFVNTNETTAHFRHAGWASAAFCDGHVAMEKARAGSMDARLPRHQIGQLEPDRLAWSR